LTAAKLFQSKKYQSNSAPQYPHLEYWSVIFRISSTGSIFQFNPVMPFFKEDFYSAVPYLFSMKDKGTSKGKSRKPESIEGTAVPGTDTKATPAKNAPMTAKEKIAANQKSKRRK
jgi:hypothetical protein